jgi:hypothetical protein
LVNFQLFFYPFLILSSVGVRVYLGFL